MAAVNGAGGGMPMMNNGANGATPRPGNEEEEPNFEARLNTYIYDYFVKTQRFECAKAMLNDGMQVRTKRPNSDVNGAGNMHVDSKDDLDSKIPDELPLAAVPTDPQGASFLLEWFGLFWDVYFAHQRRSPPASQPAMQYVQRTQQESRMLRQEQQNNAMLRVPGMMPNGMNNMNDYQRMLFQQQNGMPVNGNDLRQKALQNQNRHLQYATSSSLSYLVLADHSYRNPQQMQMLQKQQMLQHQMRRDPSEMEMNGQRPRTPSSGDNAPSPSKRPRMEGHPGMMMQGGRPQHMLDQAGNSPNALLMQGGVPPNLSEAQLMAFQQQPLQVQQKSLDVYNQNLRNNEQRQNMNKPGMPGQGSPMMQPGMDMNAEFYGANMHMTRGGMPNGNGAQNGGNHALQDYQMQLMLLEQQNKKRLLMARQEQEIPRGPDGQPGMPGAGGFVGPAGMSPSGSRSNPSPNPNDQMKRGTPKLAQAGLPGSPMPDGNMSQARGSPASAMTLGNGMQGDMFPMKNMNEGMAVMGPNGNLMRQAPSSHPNFNGQFNPQQMAEMQRNRTAMSNGNWQHGPPGQAPMMQQQQPPPPPQQPSQMGTPQQRGNMPPPSGVPAGAAANGRPGSPAQPPAPPTPSQSNKANPKGKKEPKDRKKPTKKNSTAGTVTAATPSSEADNPPPTPTPSTPITPIHPNSFNGQKNEAQSQAAIPQGPTTSAPAVEQPQPETNGMDGYAAEGGDMQGAFDMTFGNFNSDNHFEGFDFDSFLQADLMDADQFAIDNGTEAIGGT
ncbi:MAG: hypothetical protein LQ346_000121 [Caloplaca aetnensis]|nr:MAG: hypothetical protein LQ346_000121 [Caloplaca aetnensis]